MATGRRSPRRGSAGPFPAGPGGTERALNLRLVRHGESTANAEERWQGRADFPLSQAGARQAERLRSRLEREGYTPTRIYTSPLSRALETARIVASGWDRAVESWDDLVESDVGAFTGLTHAEVEERFPEVARDFGATRDLDLIDGAETHVERTARAQRASTASYATTATRTACWCSPTAAY